jgi:hypothetical protein
MRSASQNCVDRNGLPEMKKAHEQAKSLPVRLLGELSSYQR